MHRLFVSYSHKDSASAAAVVGCLKRRGLKVWFDQESIRASQDVVREIDLALGSCDLFLLFASRAYFESEWATAEYRAALYMALSRKNLSVGVITLDDAPLPPLVAPLKHVAFTTAEEVCGEVARLFPSPDGGPTQTQSARGAECSWDALEDSLLYVILDATFANLGSLRQRPGAETTFRVEVSRLLYFEVTLSLPLIRNEILMADLQAEWRVFKILKRTVSSHTESLTRGGLGIFQPAFEIALEEKLSELNTTRARVVSQLTAIAPSLVRHETEPTEAERS